MHPLVKQLFEESERQGYTHMSFSAASGIGYVLLRTWKGGAIPKIDTFLRAANFLGLELKLEKKGLGNI